MMDKSFSFSDFTLSKYRDFLSIAVKDYSFSFFEQEHLSNTIF